MASRDPLVGSTCTLGARGQAWKGEASGRAQAKAGWGPVSTVGQPGGAQGPAVLLVGRLSMELDYGGGVEFWHQASDLIPEQPCTGVSVLSSLALPVHLGLRGPCEPSDSPGPPPPGVLPLQSCRLLEGRSAARPPHLCGSPGAE